MSAGRFFTARSRLDLQCLLIQLLLCSVLWGLTYFFFCKMIDKKINPEVIIVCMGSIEVVTLWGASAENLPGTIHVAFKGNAHLAQKIISSLFHTIMINYFQTDRSKQTVQTQIRLLLEEQSDQGLRCLLFNLHLSF